MLRLWRIALAVLVAVVVVWAFLSVGRAGYDKQVSYMSEYCRAEAQLHIHQTNDEIGSVSCVMRGWDGGLAYFDVLGGPPFLKFSCYADEGNWFLQKMERCEFSPP